jgi:DNA-binding MarR family transcriptional regulator
MQDNLLNGVANQLHTLAVHLLRQARISDRESGLTPERLSLLSILAYAGPQTITDLAEQEMVSLPAITRIVNYLEELDYVQRDRDSEDGRVVLVSVTESGREILEEGRRRRVEHVADILSSMRRLELMVVSEATDLLDRIIE